LQSASRWPNADLLSSADFEIRDTFDPNTRTIC